MRTKNLAMVVALLVSIALTSPSRAAPSPEEIQSLLDARASALERGDKQAFLATVDGSDQDFLGRQTKWFDGLAALPASGFSLRLDLAESPDMTRQKDRQRYNGSPTVVAAVEHRYRLDGFDTAPAVADQFLTFVHRNGSWKVASDSALEDLGILTEHDPWEFGAIQIKHSEHFMAVFHPEHAGISDALLAACEAALTEVGDVWKRPWHTKVPVLVPASQAELVEMFGDTFDVSNFVAFASATLDRDAPSGWDLTGVRIVVNPPNFFRGEAARRTDTLAHELVHVATRNASGPFVPIFVEEGIAQLVQDRGTRSLDARIRAGRFDRRFPEDHEFLTGGASEILNSYAESLSALDHMTRRFGIDKVNEFYIALGSLRVEPGTPRYHLESTVSRVFGTTLAELESAWATEAVRQAR